MALPTTSFSVTLHHLAPGATAAGVGYPDEQMQGVTTTQLAELLQALSQVASHTTIYEPSSPEIRIKGDREILVVRTRYRRLCLVGREITLRGEPPRGALPPRRSRLCSSDRTVCAAKSQDAAQTRRFPRLPTPLHAQPHESTRA